MQKLFTIEPRFVMGDEYQSPAVADLHQAFGRQSNRGAPKRSLLVCPKLSETIFRYQTTKCFFVGRTMQSFRK